MSSGSNSSWISSPLEGRLLRLLLTAEGVHEAARFAFKCKGDLKALDEELANSLEIISDPDSLKAQMRPGASPRIYRDAYISGLKEAIEIIRNFEESAKG